MSCAASYLQRVHAGGILLLAAAAATAGESGRRAAYLCIPAGVMILLTLIWGGSIEDHTIRARWDSFRTNTKLTGAGSVDSRYQNIVLAEAGGEYSVFLDGLVATSFPNPHELAVEAHFVMCQAINTKRVLVIGGGMESGMKTASTFE